MSAEEKKAAFPVRLIDIPERQAAYIRVTNALELDRVLAALKTLIEWAKSHGRNVEIENAGHAIRRHKSSGDIHKVATAWDYLYRDWLINSAYEPEHAPALEVFLDKQSAMDWSHFELELCLPLRKQAEMRSGRRV